MPHDHVGVSLVSPDELRASGGEVTTTLLIDPTTDRPHSGGLFSERIFGPIEDWACACGRLQGEAYAGKTCSTCNVLIATRSVRGQRFGHIELASPVLHPWFYRACADLIDLPRATLKRLLSGRVWLTLATTNERLQSGSILSLAQVQAAREKFGESLSLTTGTAAVRILLGRLDLGRLQSDLHAKISSLESKEPANLLEIRVLNRRKLLVDGLIASGNRPDWMILDVLPVLPAGLRVRGLQARRLTRHYQEVIRCNAKFRILQSGNASESTLHQQARRLQRRVRALFACLADASFRSKRRRLVDGLLAVVAPDTSLRLDHCGLPEHLAWPLFHCAIVARLQQHGFSLAEAGDLFRTRDEDARDALVEVIAEGPIILAWEPVQKREHFQAFTPMLVSGSAVRVNPAILSLTGGTFDGQAVRIRVLQSPAARDEARTRLNPCDRLRSLADGNALLAPTADAVVGCAYLTAEHPVADSTRPPNRADSSRKSFFGPDEVRRAHDAGKVGIHDRIAMRFPLGTRKLMRMEKPGYPIVFESPYRSRWRIQTTVGRVFFDELLDPRMPFYDMPQSVASLRRVIAECEALLGAPEAASLVERIVRLGCQAATRAGLSLSASDLDLLPEKPALLLEEENKAQSVLRSYIRGFITEMERYASLFGRWFEVEKQAFELLKGRLATLKQAGGPSSSVLALLKDSGVWTNERELMRLTGVGRLSSNLKGTLLEFLQNSSLFDGLTMPEFFNGIQHLRRGSATTAVNTPRASSIAGKLFELTQKVVITDFDCGTTQGVTKRAIYNEEKIECCLSMRIRGLVIRHPITTYTNGEEVVIAHENEMITWEQAQRIESLGIDNVRVRSPLTCQAPSGVCQLCYGMDLSTNMLVEKGMPVGPIASNSIGELANPLMKERTVRFGLFRPVIAESEIRAKRAGLVRYVHVSFVTNAMGERLVTSSRSEVQIIDFQGQILEAYPIEYGSKLLVPEGQMVLPRTLIVEIDLSRPNPIFSERNGRIRFKDIVVGDTLEKEIDRVSGAVKWKIKSHRRELLPQILIVDELGAINETHHLFIGAELKVSEGEQVSCGCLLAFGIRREFVCSADAYYGEATAVFEARPPRRSAVLAEISGIVRFGEPRESQRAIIIDEIDLAEKPTGVSYEHLVPNAHPLRVFAGDSVRMGERLTEGSLNPHDILRLQGVEALQNFLLEELQKRMRFQGIQFDDKHIEIVIAQMLKMVEVGQRGDTDLVPGTVLTKAAFREVNEQLGSYVKIEDPGDSPFTSGRIISIEAFKEAHASLEMAKKKLPTCVALSPAMCNPILLGITQAARFADNLLDRILVRGLGPWFAETALACTVDNS